MIGEPISHIDFWDVGQADCTVLNFTDGSVSIIDTGRRGSPLVDWLAERSLEIHSISLTHNDSDHAGALGSLVAAHSSRIRQIYLLRDRPIKDKKFQTLFRRAFAWEEQKHGTLQELRTGMTIWENGATKLTVVHPSLSQSVLANSPNATSAILVLQHNGRWLAVWPGDISLPVLAKTLKGQAPFVVMGPHHGSPMGYDKRKESIQHVHDIAPTRSFISVGSANIHGHPRARYLKLLARNNCHVVCSQLNRACDPRADADNPRPVFNGTARLGLRSPRGGVSCRGSWRLHFLDGELMPDPYDEEHRAEVKKLSWPLCTRGKGFHVAP